MSDLVAVDVGSNAVRMKVAHWNGKELNCLYRTRSPIRLGADVFKTGRISKQNARNLVDAFVEFRSLLDHNRNFKIRAVATSAFREAKNAKYVKDWIYRTSKIRLEVIDFHKEATLIYKAVTKNLQNLKGNSVLMDIGGGSVEFIRFNSKGIQNKISLPLGTVRLLNRHHTLTGIQREIDEYRPMIRDFVFGSGDISQIVGTGGNFETFFSLKKNHFHGSNKARINLRQIHDIIAKLTMLTIEQRQKIYHMRADRADVIIPALCVSQMFMEASGQTRILIPRVGLREGLIYDLI
ncbi:MAG: hypothetical protein KDD25_02280 [Bdellovibrionales bacterium]|nr:hypothetical protein [Bdellovibrionales bacterium]